MHDWKDQFCGWERRRLERNKDTRNLIYVQYGKRLLRQGVWNVQPWSFSATSFSRVPLKVGLWQEARCQHSCWKVCRLPRLHELRHDCWYDYQCSYGQFNCIVHSLNDSATSECRQHVQGIDGAMRLLVVRTFRFRACVGCWMHWSTQLRMVAR